MEEEIKPIRPPLPGILLKRPVFLSFLCIFSGVFFSVLTLLFFTGIFQTSRIIDVLGQYTPPESYTRSQISGFFISLFLLHLTGLMGIFFIWRLRKTGYFLLALSCLIISSFQLFQPQLEWTTTFVYIFFLLAFGLYFKGLH